MDVSLEHRHGTESNFDNRGHGGMCRATYLDLFWISYLANFDQSSKEILLAEGLHDFEFGSPEGFPAGSGRLEVA